MNVAWKKAKNRKMCYLFLAPYAILFTMFYVFPVVASIYYSFTYYNILESPRFLGFANYVSLILEDDIFLIGGAALYNRFYRMCDRLYVTKMDADLNADTFIVNFDDDPDYEMESESEPVTENGITYRFVVYRRKG